jgi:hypothetical protein
MCSRTALLKTEYLASETAGLQRTTKSGGVHIFTALQLWKIPPPYGNSISRDMRRLFPVIAVRISVRTSARDATAGCTLGRDPRLASEICFHDNCTPASVGDPLNPPTPSLYSAGVTPQHTHTHTHTHTDVTAAARCGEPRSRS